MNLTFPKTDQIIASATNVGAVGVGLIVGKILQETLMTGKNGGKSIIPDNLLTNASAMSILAIGSIFVSNKFVSMLMLATSGYFMIRTLNKGTEKLNGLNGLQGGIKDFLTKYVPQLNGIEGGYDGAVDMYYGTEGAGYGNLLEETPYNEVEMETSVNGFNPVQAGTMPSKTAGKLY